MSNPSGEQYNGPYTVTIIDMFDANPYADVFDDERYAIIGRNYSSLDIARDLSNRLFVALNPKVDSLEKWEDLEGHDVRIYDSKMECVYKAHEKFKAKSS